MMRLGKRAGISWAWVSWIPGGAGFVQAKIINWDLFWLFPTLSLAGVLIDRIHYVGWLITLVVAVFSMIQAGQLLGAFGRSPYLVLLNLIPIVGSIIYLVILFKIQHNEYQRPEKTWYGGNR